MRQAGIWVDWRSRHPEIISSRTVGRGRCLAALADGDPRRQQPIGLRDVQPPDRSGNCDDPTDFRRQAIVRPSTWGDRGAGNWSGPPTASSRRPPPSCSPTWTLPATNSKRSGPRWSPSPAAVKPPSPSSSPITPEPRRSSHNSDRRHYSCRRRADRRAPAPAPTTPNEGAEQYRQDLYNAQQEAEMDAEALPSRPGLGAAVSPGRRNRAMTNIRGSGRYLLSRRHSRCRPRLGLVVIGVAVFLVAVVAGIRPHLVSGAGQAAPVPGPPVIGRDCVLGPPPRSTIRRRHPDWTARSSLQLLALPQRDRCVGQRA